MKLFEATNIPLLSKALNAYAMRHKVIANNLANIGTVDYKSKRVSFEEQLGTALQENVVVGPEPREQELPVTPGRFDQVIAKIKENSGEADNDPYTSGMNDVDIDQEMAELAKNQLRFKIVSRLLADTFRGIQKSIRGNAG